MYRPGDSGSDPKMNTGYSFFEAADGEEARLKADERQRKWRTIDRMCGFWHRFPVKGPFQDQEAIRAHWMKEHPQESHFMYDDSQWHLD